MALESSVSLATRLTAQQMGAVSYPRDGGGSLLLCGLPGTGKSTALMARLAALLREGRRPYEMLVLVPQRAQVERYERALAAVDAPTRGGVDLVTFYSLSRRAVALFWPLIARAAGFAQPDREPTFLTIETTQYFMWRLVEPLMAREGYFGDLAIRRGRLLSQLIDNLNKSALVGFDHTDILRRLRAAWTGSPDHINSYWQAQDCAIRFRQYCLQHNLLDFSLVTEIFHRYMLQNVVYQRYLYGRYRHLVVDNLEENVPVAHDFVAWIMPRLQSSVLAVDEGGGFRVFLGADAEGARKLGAQCTASLMFGDLLEPTGDSLAFSDAVRRALRVPWGAVSAKGQAACAVLGQGGGRYWVNMVDWVAEQIGDLVGKGISPGEIAIVAPYVSEVMRFAMQERLALNNIAVRLIRPATPLRDEAVIRALLTLVLLGHPQWRISIQGEEQPLVVEDVALVLQTALVGLDPIRARHLAQGALMAGGRGLADMAARNASGGALWEAVGYQVRQPYETLRVWLDTYQRGEAEPVDIFLMRLFGELLSRPGFGFHDRVDKARAYGRLVESAAKFREAVGQDTDLDPQEMARQYVELVLGGVATAEYMEDWRPSADDPSAREAVILAPAYAYLTRDVRSTYQFWMDLGSDGWWNRPNQPLTHPFILSRQWPVGQPWRDVEEEESRRAALGRVIQGLAARCTGGIYLGYSELGIDGAEQGGRLQRAVMVSLARLMRDG